MAVPWDKRQCAGLIASALNAAGYRKDGGEEWRREDIEERVLDHPLPSLVLANILKVGPTGTTEP
jgi:hypothetical protein